MRAFVGKPVSLTVTLYLCFLLNVSFASHGTESVKIALDSPSESIHSEIRHMVGSLPAFLNDVSWLKNLSAERLKPLFFTHQQTRSSKERRLNVYFAEYIRYISKGALQFVEVLGVGVQAYTVKVVAVHTTEFAVLKFYRETCERYCFAEQNVLLKIASEVNRGSGIYALPTIDDGRLFCGERSFILMEYIDAKPLALLREWPESIASQLLDTMRTVIPELGRVGIGHFDWTTNNILMNKEENSFSLIDFGLAVNLPLLKGTDVEIRQAAAEALERSLRPQWLTVSPELVDLRLLLLDLLEHEDMIIDRELLSQLITDANLYSMEALTMAKYKGKEWIEGLLQCCHVISKEYKNTGWNSTKLETWVQQIWRTHAIEANALMSSSGLTFHMLAHSWKGRWPKSRWIGQFGLNTSVTKEAPTTPCCVCSIMR